MSVNVFIVNRDSVSRNADMNVCLMIRDICVFGCECGADAAALAESVVPELVFFRVFPEDTDVFAVIKRLAEIYPPSLIAVAAFHSEAGGELEKKCREAGAFSFFPEDISNDNFLYVIKNYTDIIRSRRERKIHDEAVSAQSGKFCSFITEVSGYNDILSMNRRFGSLNVRPGLSGNLIYIRVFSFLYDFLVKCFLKDLKITVGAAADARRIIILFMNGENICGIMKEAAFYSAAEKYITADRDFCKIYLAIDGEEFGKAADISDVPGKRRLPFNFDSPALFETALEDSSPGIGSFSRMRETAGFYSGSMDIFCSLENFLSSYSPSEELEFHRCSLTKALKDTDAALAESAAFSNGEYIGGSLFDIENDLYEAVLKLQIILHTYRRI